VIGVIADGLAGRDSGFAAVDHLDFRDWLARHGARRPTLDSGIVRGMYDLVFAYEEGDPSRPRFAAGQGLELAARFFFDYKGSIFWKMTAGMGDVVIAPLYDALRRRGVRFRLSCEVERIELRDDRPALAAVHLRDHGSPDDDPLRVVGGLPCFTDGHVPGSRHAPPRRDVVRMGVDADVVVLAASIGVIPIVAPGLVARDERWAESCASIGTVATRAAQVWWREDEAELGLRDPGSTSSGWGPPFDTYASMSHLLDAEQWDNPAPRGLGYLCGVLTDDVATRSAREARALVDRDLDGYLEHGVERVLPGTHDDQGLRDGVVVDRFTVASVHPSDRYVQSLPGTRGSRLGAAASGVDGMVLAGDWTATGLDAGCIEAAVISGIQAANVVADRDVDHTVLGGWRSPASDTIRPRSTRRRNDGGRAA
jgi:hypothetical protein